MNEAQYRMILGSQSPRRKQLLGWLGLNFEVSPSNIEEISLEKHPVALAKDIAYQKGVDVFKRFQSMEGGLKPLIVSADTVVAIDDQILGKPKDRDDAKRMLKLLAGREHLVVTGVYLLADKTESLFACQTKVTFAPIEADFLERYLDSGEPFDKAGSYGIQGMANCFISKIEGSYTNVVGFPIAEFQTELQAFCQRLTGKPAAAWRSHFV